MNIRRAAVVLVVAVSMVLGTAGFAAAGPMTGMWGSDTTTPGEMGPGMMFGDVGQDAWYGGYAEQMVGHGFMAGYDNGTFGPHDPITRGQFAAIMARMNDLEPIEGNTFGDLGGFWGAGYVEALAQNGMVHGYGDGHYGPYDTITRGQMAAIMDRASQRMVDLGLVQDSGVWTEDPEALRSRVREHMTDVSGFWGEDHVAHMYGLGVVAGDGEGYFHPYQTTNRAQGTAMMWRWYEALGLDS